MYVFMYKWSVDEMSLILCHFFFHVHTGRGAPICFMGWGFGHREAAIGRESKSGSLQELLGKKNKIA